MTSIPSWGIVHVPHDSREVPGEVRSQFVLNESALDMEILKMTDHLTYALFAKGLPRAQVVRSTVSRLVVDVERFERDQDEVMSARGMGAIYMKTQEGAHLRRDLSLEERNELLNKWYRPHHQLLTDSVDFALAQFGQAIVIDAHSFPKLALPYEMNQGGDRPEICIGSDDFHTPGQLVDSLVCQFEKAGLTTGVNDPFSGALVPAKHYRKDKRVAAVMIEVRRDVYLNESTGEPTSNFSQISKIIQSCLELSILELENSR